MKQGILFDLDGTLWDSSTEVAISWEEALRKRPDVQKEITGEMIRNVMGKSMYDIADILFGEYDLQTRRSLLDYCCKEENEYIRLHGGRLFESLAETLQALRGAGFFLSIVSNCQIGYIEAFLEYHGLGQYFGDFECFGKTEQGKGHNIRLVVERNHLDQALYVGDTQGDYQAATEAGLPFIHARMGYGTVDAEVPFITALSQLPQAVRRVFGELSESGQQRVCRGAAQCSRDY